jgi:hypothetical protein
MPKKLTKKEADYGIGKPKAHCGICRHFKKPNACEIIEGKIEPLAWCKYFEKGKRWSNLTKAYL